MGGFILDHVGVAVKSLDEAEKTFTRLGFSLTPRSAHTGRATGNHCAMLQNGYLEFIGIMQPDTASSFYDMVARYEGGHIVAFGCDNAQDTYSRLKTRHPRFSPPELLERDAPFGPEGNETRRAAFQNIYNDSGEFPEARFIFIEHLTPEVLWQPHQLTHPNGATGIIEVAICAQDVEAASGRLSSALEVTAEPKGPGFTALDLERGRVYVLDAETVPKWAKGVKPPAVPSVVGVGVTVSDLDATKAYLKENGVPYSEFPYPAIWVSPEHAHGTVFSFIQHD